ncbi:DsbC family protein [Trichlorobacter lovleyi]|uniref:DsbC family protein n=1 Tax=Trichlorobacter lovleyi TaxID=313985 RepID=UPI0023F4140E|nr:DsbC family protein [Trichlorobacter lovleyi]
MIRTTLLSISLMLLFAVSSFAMPIAKDGCGTQECSKCHSLSVKEATDLLSFAGVTVKSVKPAPSHGMHEVLFQKDGGVGIVFIDYGKKHLIQGVVIDLKTKEPVAAHDKELPGAKQFSGLDPKLIPVQYAMVMGNPKSAKKLYVFTDPDCPYCRTLHPELQKLEKMMPDLAIHIMLYPLKQLHPHAYDKARVVLATKSRKNLDLAFEGKDLPKPKGDEGKADVDAVIQFAQEQGINGTPMVLLPNGRSYQGPRTAEQLKEALK